LQIAAGGFVAGLDAGMGYNTWPKMDGRWLPQGFFIMQPKILNLFENAMTVQFNHRVIAYVVLLVALVHAWRTFSMSGAILVYALLVQMALGIFTLISHVQIALALSHQAGAMIVLALAIWHLHRKSLERSGALAPAVV
jgi:cytochrome c oxidase assembly protein subunit 15